MSNLSEDAAKFQNSVLCTMYLYPQTFNNIAVENSPERILWTNYRLIAKTLMIATYWEAERINYIFHVTVLPALHGDSVPLLKRVKTQVPCSNLFPPNPPMIKTMGIYQYSRCPDPMEKNPTLYCNCMERRLVLMTINLFIVLCSPVIHKNLGVCGAVQT